MNLPVIQLPRAVPVPRERKPQDNIPELAAEREQIRMQLREYVRRTAPVAPLSLEELRGHSETFAEQHSYPAKFVDFIGVLLNSEVWRDALASVPFERRLLLLPKCLRIEDQCPAPFDEFGLLCKQCGLCSIQELQNEAERLGYAVLVAEGSALVTAMIATGKIEAIVGVSCLSVLEKAFPYMESAAIPGIAIPLLQDDCIDTTVDLDWIWEVIHLTSDDKTYRLNLDALRAEVESWFTPDSLGEILGTPQNKTDEIAHAWLAKTGKRWRPFLAVCVYKALQDDPDAELPDDLRKVAVAVECFHKASLIHDDIEDDDALRYGEQTLHEEYGVPIALNIGDLLLGEGYRLIAECDAAPENKTQMLRVAAAGHRELCLGQGAELYWAEHPEPLTSSQVLDIFRRKTAPAFEVALRMGAAYAGNHGALTEVLAKYSEALGIAYQIRDDLDDLETDGDPDDLTAMRPSLPLALVQERVKAKKDQRALVESVWRRTGTKDEVEQVRMLMKEYGIADRCRALLESYKEESVRSLIPLENASLKGLLRRVISKIFRIEVEGWCHEFETRNAASGAAVDQAAG